ncbi:MAG: hypothetical protein ACREEB_00850 [Caulobacteraceae bacterium]
MVQIRYTGITNPNAAFARLKPFRDELIALSGKVRPTSTDYKILHVLIGALDTTAYHFTREPDFFATRPQQSTWRPGD